MLFAHNACTTAGKLKTILPQKVTLYDWCSPSHKIRFFVNKAENFNVSENVGMGVSKNGPEFKQFQTFHEK